MTPHDWGVVAICVGIMGVCGVAFVVFLEINQGKS